MACCCRPSVPLDEVLLVLLPWCCSSSEGVLSSLRLLDLGSLLLLLLRLGLPLDGHEALWDSICVVVLVVDPPVHGLSHVSWCVWHHLHTRPPQSLQTECTVRERHLLQSKCIEGGVGLAAPLLRWPPLLLGLVAWAVGTCWNGPRQVCSVQAQPQGCTICISTLKLRTPSRSTGCTLCTAGCALFGILRTPAVTAVVLVPPAMSYTS